jgi:nucleotide-binding universal stress UspA family protein
VEANVETEIRTILLATDFMQSSRLALDYAESLASKLKAQLVIVNAFELSLAASNGEKVDHIPSHTRLEAEARLEAFAVGCNRAGVSANTVLVEGAVPEAILSTVNKYKADLLVLGAQGVHRGMDHLLLGSNIEAVMLRCPCPTLTIGPHVLAAVNLKSLFTKVIYLSNLRPAAAAAAPFALKLSQKLAISIEIYQVVRGPVTGGKDASLKEKLEDYCSRLQLLRPNVREEWCNPEYQRERIVSPQEVIELALDPSALLVVGVQATSFLARHLCTSYPYRLLANAACPIITVCSHENGEQNHRLAQQASCTGSSGIRR